MAGKRSTAAPTTHFTAVKPEDMAGLPPVLPAFETFCKTCNKRVVLVADVMGADNQGYAQPRETFTCNCGREWRIEAKVSMREPAPAVDESDDDEDTSEI